MSRRWLLEKHAAHAVEIEMRDHGKQRDKKLRTALTRKWSEAYGTTPAAVPARIRLRRSIISPPLFCREYRAPLIATRELSQSA